MCNYITPADGLRARLLTDGDSRAGLARSPRRGVRSVAFVPPRPGCKHAE